jgi:hypothetical protein
MDVVSLLFKPWPADPFILNSRFRRQGLLALWPLAASQPSWNL